MLGLLTLPDLVRDAAERFGDHPAYVEDGATLSYADLHPRVRAAAAGYVLRGLRPGDHVVLWGPNSIDWAVAALAVSYAGGVLVPVNSRYVGPEVADVARRVDARFVVVHDGFLGRDQVGELAEAGVTDPVVTLAEVVSIVDATADFPPRSPDDVADVLFTSGTTGRSKGAMSAHRQTVGVARAWAELGGVRQDDRYLVVNPFFHSFGYKIGIVVGLLTGCTLYPAATFDVDATMQLIQDERITVLPGAPTIYQSLLSAPDRDAFDLSSLRLAVTGAAVVPVVLIERMRAPSPEGLAIDQVVTAFGMTEAVVVTMCRDGDSAETVATTNGRAIPGMEIAIGAPHDHGEGELLVRGEHVMLGYLDDPEATAKAIDADGWLHTGDVGEVDAARQPADHRPAQGHVHQRRLQRLPRRGRAGAAPARRRRRRRRGGRARRADGRGGQGVRRRLGLARRRRRARQGEPGELQGAAARRGGRRAAAQPLGQGAEDGELRDGS